MKPRFIIASLFCMGVTMLANSTELSAQGTAKKAAKSKTLVVYFSHTGENYSVGNITEGNTAILAKMIQQKTGADTFEIVPEKAYPSAYRPCTDVAKTELREKARPAYKGNISTDDYDTIYLGYPIWWGDMPMVVYTFLESHDLNGKTIIPFCTHEGSGVSGTDSNIKRVYKNATIKNPLAMYGHTAQNSRAEAQKQVESWLSKN